MMRVRFWLYVLSIVSLVFVRVTGLSSQELYPFTQPASNMPAGTIGAVGGWSAFDHDSRFVSRAEFELMYGYSADLMLHATVFASNVYSPQYQVENANIYAKYRFYNDDGTHEHFRMAVYAEATFGSTGNTKPDVNLRGDNAGIGAGIIATQLLGRFAGSVTFGINRALPDSQYYYATGLSDLTDLHYSLSLGYLLLPITYSGYSDVNVNLYSELLGKYQRYATPTDPLVDGNIVDMGLGLQFIFESRTRLDIALRQQLSTSIPRSTDRMVYVRLEHNFF